MKTLFIFILLVTVFAFTSCNDHHVIAKTFQGEKVYIKTKLYEPGDTVILYFSTVADEWVLDKNWLDRQNFDVDGEYHSTYITYCLAVIQ